MYKFFVLLFKSRVVEKVFENENSFVLEQCKVREGLN